MKTLRKILRPALLISMSSAWLTFHGSAATVYENYTFTTLAGSTPGWHDGLGGDAGFHYPCSVGVDAAGNTVVADAGNHTIRKVSPAGMVTTLAGLAGNPGKVDGIGGAARFNSPSGVAVAADGTVYVADTQNHAIRKISTNGVVTTLAGLAGTSGKADGPAKSARFYHPQDVAVDISGNVYVADTYNSSIRKITPAGVVTTLAGLSGSIGNVNGKGTGARFTRPYGIATDTAGNLFVGDTYNHTIRKVTSAGVVTTLAGSAGNSGSADGTNSTARFYYPCGLSVDGAGNIFVADIFNNTIRKITPDGVVTTPVGLATVVGSTDGTGSTARFNNPESVAVGQGTNLYVADLNNHTIRKISPGWIVTTLAGTPSGSGTNDGIGLAAKFNYPSGVVVDTNGNTFVADLSNNTIRKIAPDGSVTTLAGQAGVSGSADGTGSAARFYYPIALALGPDGTLYVVEYGNSMIRKIDAGGTVTTLAGSTNTGSADGPGLSARFNQPCGIAVTTNGIVYVGDTSNNEIRKITPDGTVSTLAGSTNAGALNGVGTAARLSWPQGIALDSEGNLLVADAKNNMIRKVTPDGAVTTIAGSTNSGAADGIGTAASFHHPFGVAIDRSGNVFVSDSFTNTIRKIAPNGNVTTLGGAPGIASGDDGTGAQARFNTPEGLAVDQNGNLYIADATSQLVRKGSPALADWPMVDYPATSALGSVRHLSDTNGAATSWSWSLIRYPANSTAQLTSTNTANSSFTPDVADLFVVRLHAVDSQGHSVIAGVNVGADAIAPKLTIASPKSGQRVTNAVLSASGTTSDDLTTATVWCQVNSNDWFQATGTTSWKANLALTPGTNLIRAYTVDVSGNHSATQSVSIYYAAFTPMQVAINGKGTVAPNYNGQSLEITKSYRMTATASGGFAFRGWSGSLVSGAATLNFVMRSNLSLTANFKDIVRPTLAVSYPKPNQLVSNALLTATGIAGDNYRLASIWYRLNSGDWLQLAGTNKWATDGLTLTPGTNVLQAYAVDADGNLSVTSKVSFTHVLSAPLTLAISGQGTLSPNYSNALLQIGKTYTITAKPGSGNVFSNWTGLFSTNAATLSFTMQSNLALQANFVPTPFPHLQGNYAGLFTPTSGVTAANAGYFAGKIDGAGNFSGSLTLGTTTYPLSGPVSVGGAWTKSITRPGKTTLGISLQADLAGGETLTGSVGDGIWTANLAAFRAVYSPTNPAPQAGQRYTFAIPGSDDPATAPAGFGYGWITADASGNLTVGGVLGDGSAFSRSTTVARQGQWPFFASVNSAAGIVIGWMMFSSDVGSDLHGVLSWHRDAQTTAKLYPAGFDLPALAVLGSVYTYSNGVPLLNSTNGQLILSGGNLSQSVTNAYTLAGTRITGPNLLSLTATNSTGLFRGTITNALSRNPITVSGALLQKQNAGYGNFSGTNQTGSAFLKGE